MTSLLNIKSGAAVCLAAALFAGHALVADDVKAPAGKELVQPEVQPPVAQPPVLKDNIDRLQLENTSVNDALVLLSQICDRKIVVDPRCKDAIKNDVDLDSTDTRLDVVLGKILTPNNMTYDVRDGEVVILPAGAAAPVADAPKPLALKRDAMLFPAMPEFKMPKMPKLCLPPLGKFPGAAEMRVMTRGQQLEFSRKFLSNISGMAVPNLDPAAEIPAIEMPVFPAQPPAVIIIP